MEDYRLSLKINPALRGRPQQPGLRAGGTEGSAEAIPLYEAALRASAPNHAEVNNNLGNALVRDRQDR